MIFQWILAITLVMSAGFLLGLCVLLFRYYSSHKHRYKVHIALMSASDVIFTALIIGQIVPAMFGLAFPPVATIVMIYLTLWLKIGGLLRLFKHRKD